MPKFAILAVGDSCGYDSRNIKRRGIRDSDRLLTDGSGRDSGKTERHGSYSNGFQKLVPPAERETERGRPEAFRLKTDVLALWQSHLNPHLGLFGQASE